MNIAIGTLRGIPAKERPALLAPVVVDALAAFAGADAVNVAEIDPLLSDTAAFCEHYKVGMHQAANCVVLEAKRADRTWFAACVVLGSTRADVNGVARRILNARRISFAPMEQAVERTAMEYGAITPIGLPSDWPILIDRAVVETDHVIIGSGMRKSKLLLAGSALALLPTARVIDGLGQIRKE